MRIIKGETMTQEEKINESLLSVIVQLDALRGLVLAIFDSNTEKDAILASFLAQSGKLGDLLLDSPVSDDFLVRQAKAYEVLYALAARSVKGL